MDISRVVESRHIAKIETIMTNKSAQVRVMTECGHTVRPCDSLVHEETQPCTIDMADGIRSWPHAGGYAVRTTTRAACN